MAVGVTQVGANFRMTVATTFAGTYEPVSHINAISRPSNRTITQFAAFGLNPSIGVPGPREVSYQAGGYLSIGDSGQDILRAAEAANTTVFIKMLFDGTNGFNQEVRVGSQTFSAAPDGLQLTTFEFSAVGTAVIIGTGPVL